MTHPCKLYVSPKEMLCLTHDLDFHRNYDSMMEHFYHKLQEQKRNA